MPFFSVLIPSYNRPELIAETVRSILNSDFKDFELIISDDKSPRQDEIVKALKPFLNDSRLHFHLQPENLREPGNRDFLFRKAQGQWHIALGDDDLLYPHALSTLAKAIKKYPGADIYTFGYAIINEFGCTSYSRQAPKPLRVSFQDERLTRELVISNTFPYWMYHPATFCARKDVGTMVKSSGDVGIGDDIMFMIDLVNSGGVLQIVPSVLMCYRKISVDNEKLQINQSAGELPQLIARARILHQLMLRSDLKPTLAEFVANPRCRERLLYDSILWGSFSIDDLQRELELSSEEMDELRVYAKRRPRVLYRRWLSFRRALFFLSLFGFAGLSEMWKVVFQRILKPRSCPI